ncbi:hypothetical protein EVAR_83895_1 [Eumeta japonica]|uniref:Uncharacterized protein n=1 Tax=Eumeta variegata TaxID=151549 RepID=A0A4C1URB4_EUMVA|nr:hypothetical protein EVAR_83895_1 [Eumeta japonica]
MPEWKGRVPLTRSHCERITPTTPARYFSRRERSVGKGRRGRCTAAVSPARCARPMRVNFENYGYDHAFLLAGNGGDVYRRSLAANCTVHSRVNKVSLSLLKNHVHCARVCRLVCRFALTCVVEAVRASRERFGISVNWNTTLSAAQRFCDFGKFRPPTSVDRGANIINVEIQENILRLIEENPENMSHHLDDYLSPCSPHILVTRPISGGDISAVSAPHVTGWHVS